jgi:meiotically up-regulated gene 157 (Mug157) protein
LYNKVENNKTGDNKRIRRNKDEKVWERYFTIDECCYGSIVVYRVWEG